MRICVIGAGIAGLTAALRLSAREDLHVEVYEAEAHFGGRADVSADGEHCPRFFMNDYTCLLEILGQIKGPDGRSVRDSLLRVRRFAHADEAGWVEISHLYRFLAREIPLASKLRVAWSWRPSPLLAEQRFAGRGANRFGSIRNYSAPSLLRMAANLFRSKTGFVLAGPTDEHLIDPWVRRLRERGVVLETGRRATGIEPAEGGLRVRTEQGAELFDAVIVTAFVPDLAALLDASGMEHLVRNVGHTHCVAYTMDLDRREKVLTRGPGPALYSRDGINILVQPDASRCVVLCTLSPRTDEDFVLEKVRAHLGLEHPPERVRCRPNQRPGEAILAGDYTGRVLRTPVSGLYFAGSHLCNGYPIDAAEGAARTALAAARDLLADFGLESKEGRR